MNAQLAATRCTAPHSYLHRIYTLKTACTGPQTELERCGVPAQQYENCLEKRELVALLLSRPPRARSMLGVLMSKKRLGQFHAMLQEAPDGSVQVVER